MLLAAACTSVLEEHVVVVHRHLIILVTVGVEGAVVVDLCYYELNVMVGALKDWARPCTLNHTLELSHG